MVREARPATTRWRCTVTASVLLVDDNRMFADALRLAIDDDPDLRCAGIVPTSTDAVEVGLRSAPDCCVVDLDGSRERDGLEVTRHVRRDAPEVVVAVLSSRTDPDVVSSAEEAGAVHLVPTDLPVSQVLDALRVLADGGRTARDRWSAPRTEHLRRHPLTVRELEILQEMAEGAAPKELAAAMGISIHTVRGHVKNAYGKLGAHSQLEAVAIARRRQLLRSPHRDVRAPR